MTRSIQLPRSFIVAFLSSIYILGFLITPYWILYKSPAQVIFYLALTLCIGFLWLVLSTGSLPIDFHWKDVRLFLFLLAGTVVLNYRALNSVIPFRGDEALHIGRTLELADRLPVLPTLVILVLFIIFMGSGLKNQRWAFVIGIFIVVAVVLYFLGRNLFTDMEKYPLFFLRYPFINYWFFAILPKLASPISSPYHEVLYRVIPLLSMAGIVWIIQKKSGGSSLLNTIGWGLAIATLPLIFYYSSILYLEPPAVLLMTAVCLDINNLLHKSGQDIVQTPSWYALLFIGFIKETTIPFLLCFLAVRTVVQLQAWSRKTAQEKSEKTFGSLLAGELRIAFILLAPVFLYIYFRTALTTTRTFSPSIANLWNTINYRFVLLSFIEQFGPFLVFFIAGCILLIRDKEFTSLFCYLAFILAVLVFHIVDNNVYAGYSRFNLFILPPILAGSARFIAWATRQKQYITSALALIAITGNLLLSPVHLDGVKTPNWGSYRIDDSEHYYPYQDALIWLKNNQAKKRMLFTGLDFYYPFDFYWNKLDWKPKKDGIPSEGISDETLAISNILKEAGGAHYTVVVYRVLGKDPILPRETGQFRVQVIKNSAHTLLIFYKP